MASDMSRPWEGVQPPSDERVITGAVFTERTTAIRSYIDLITKWNSAPGLPDLELMGQAYLYYTITDPDGKDSVSINVEVPKEAMTDYESFLAYLELSGIDPGSYGYTMYTRSFSTDFIT